VVVYRFYVIGPPPMALIQDFMGLPEIRQMRLEHVFHWCCPAIGAGGFFDSQLEMDQEIYEPCFSLESAIDLSNTNGAFLS
jgi:hypothetical protein